MVLPSLNQLTDISLHHHGQMINAYVDLKYFTKICVQKKVQFFPLLYPNLEI